MNENDSIMPENFSQLDRLWISDQLSRLDPVTRMKVSKAYDVVFLESWENETVDFRKENSARYAANTRLRKFVERYSESRNVMYITKPEGNY